jgi:hypothetical protein
MPRPEERKEVFDPDSASWSALDSQPLARWGHTATLLPDGSVLIAGGETLDGPSIALERFDLIANGFSMLRSTLASPRKQHIAAALADGRVLIAGGSDGANDLTSTELFGAFSDSVTPGPVLREPRSAFSAAELIGGRFLLIGGSSAGTDLATSLIFDPADSRVRSGPALKVARTGAQAVRIPNNGNILVIGGTVQGMPTASTELYDAAHSVFTSYGDLTLARDGLAPAPIGDSGAILAAGGAVDGVPVAACGKTGIPTTLSSDKTTNVTGDRAILSASWGIRKENVTGTVQLTLPPFVRLKSC